MDFLREAMAVLAGGDHGRAGDGEDRAGYGERTPERLTRHSRNRNRPWDTRVRTLELRIPTVR